MRGIYGLAEDLLASQGGFCSMELARYRASIQQAFCLPIPAT